MNIIIIKDFIFTNINIIYITVTTSDMESTW